ncbi:MAG TPA: methyltransferase domain-containing protein [Candidatus Xenobia bacterium]|jgi:radical SAM protein with 4Fe4S-binding SPASM domain
MELNTDTRVRLPDLDWMEEDGAVVALDASRPHWVATDDRGRRLLELLSDGLPWAEVLSRYQASRGISSTQAWLEADTFVQALARADFPLANGPSSPRTARAEAETRLTELWVHLNDACNLACAHCLVSSAPGLNAGLPPERLQGILDEAHGLGVRRFLFTGGEPWARSDIVERIDQVTQDSELVVLTNGTLLTEARVQRLQDMPRERLRFQISLDGPTAELHEAMRGSGTFATALEGFDRLVQAGFSVTMTAVARPEVLPTLEAMADLAAAHRASALHILWPHQRGRAAAGQFQPPLSALIEAVRRLRVRARALHVSIDNDEAIRSRINGLRGVRTDLSNMVLESLCVYTDERVYPSPATVGEAALCLGSLKEQSLQAIWRDSALARTFRGLSVVDKPQCQGCRYRFLCGGGDVEHGYFHAAAEVPLGERLLSDDPYCALYQDTFKHLFVEQARERLAAFPYKSGYNRPVVALSMGEEGMVCGADRETLEGLAGRLPEVRFSRSACVLPIDVVDRSRDLVQEFYSHAAAEPQAELCCPIRYDVDDTAHIPAEVLERFYGCGGPMSMARVQPGETVVDLGSGGGIDCFIAARKVGSGGRVIGVDMTPAMLEVARTHQVTVAQNLGYDVVEFRQGFLEKLPVDDRSVQLVTSNCVINLSPDKSAVFREMWRVLTDHGRVVLSDIVSEGEVPPHLRFNPRLWGECISGALSEGEFLALLERAGFYGLTVLRKSFWKEVEGRAFHAVTVQGFKFEKTAGCVFIGQKAVYLGPWKAVTDEEGHLFPRDEAVEVCTDTASKLRNPPWSATFAVYEPDDAGRRTPVGCDPNSGCC